MQRLYSENEWEFSDWHNGSAGGALIEATLMEVRLYFLSTCRKIVAQNVNDDSNFRKQSQKYFFKSTGN